MAHTMSKYTGGSHASAMFEFIGLGEYIDPEFIDLYLSLAAILAALMSVIVFSFVFLLRTIIQLVDGKGGDKLLGLSCSFAIINALIVLVIFATFGTGHNMDTIENPINMLRTTLFFIDSTVYIFPMLSLLIFYAFVRQRYINRKNGFKYDLLTLLSIIFLIWLSRLTYSPDHTVFYMARTALFFINSSICFVQILVFLLFYVLARHHNIEKKNNLKHDQLALLATIFLIGASYSAYSSGYTDRKLAAATDHLLIHYHNYLLLAYGLYVFWAFCAWCCFMKLYQLILTSSTVEP